MQPGSFLRTTPACSRRSAASASPLPFAARIFATTVSTSAIARSPRGGMSFVAPTSRGVGGRRHDVLVAVAPGDQARVLEDVERDLESLARDLDVWRPAAELLVVGERGGQH